MVAAEEDDDPVVEDDIGKSREGSRTDDEVVQRYDIWKLNLLHANYCLGGS